jgi:aspartate dehydrogenase
VSVQNPEKHRTWLGKLTATPAVLPIEQLAEAADIVIECAPGRLLRSIVAPFVEAEKPRWSSAPARCSTTKT